MELWIKQHLAIFFDFENIGNLNWIALPLLVHFFLTIKRRRRWEKALAFVFIISCIVINLRLGHPGYPRYHLTLFPFTIGVIFLSIWEFIKKRSIFVKTFILFFCLTVIFFNFYHFKERYEFWWKYHITLESYYFPHNHLEFISQIKDLDSDQVFLVCSTRQIFFYHTSKKGIDYRNPKLNFLHSQRSKESAYDMIKNQLKIKYILVYWNFKPTLTLMDIIFDNCDLVYHDEKFYLYRIRERELSKEELESFFVNDSLLRNGSFENWNKSPINIPDNFFVKLGEETTEVKVIRDEKEVKVGRYSVKITGDSYNFSQNLYNFEVYREKQLTCFVWIKTNVPNKYRIQINDGIDKSTSKTHSGRGKWELLQVNHTVNPSAKLVRVRVQALKTGNDDVVYVDGAILVGRYWNTFYSYKSHMEQKK